MAEYEACILGLRLAIDMNVQELLVIRDSDLLMHQVLGEWDTKNTKILSYLHCVQELIERFTKIEFKHVPRIQNTFSDALATLSSMIQHLDMNFINPIPKGIQKQSAYCAHVEEEIDGNPWFHDIKKYVEKGEYLETATHTKKRMLQRLFSHFFQSGGILYRRTPDLGLLRCVDAKEASRLLEEIHVETCIPHMNDFILAKKILRVGYFWMTMETNCINGPFEPTASNGHRFILVAIDYFTKWFEAMSYKAVTKKVVADFVRDRIVCRFGVPESIITDNAANLNSDLMKDMCETFKIKHRNSTTYMPQMNGVIEAANKNIKKILRKMVDNYKQWHEKLPFAWLGYRTTVRTSTGATPYLLVYGTEAIIPAKVEISSLRIIQEAELSDAEWIRRRYEQLALIDGKIMNAVCHSQLYQNRMARAFNKKVRPRQFTPGKLVLK
ncbi:uncharacterized protein [Nicotiana tomentosiformis]|uniref:uncharacterized protein n=1 Tax=Nicotiana tomentosiformis TaxID=4098 RepID=UPI00388CE5B4